jgi:hypothetical protein
MKIKVTAAAWDKVAVFLGVVVGLGFLAFLLWLGAAMEGIWL